VSVRAGDFPWAPLRSLFQPACLSSWIQDRTPRLVGSSARLRAPRRASAGHAACRFSSESPAGSETGTSCVENQTVLATFLNLQRGQQTVCQFWPVTLW